jgi:hypothetical protein
MPDLIMVTDDKLIKNKLTKSENAAKILAEILSELDKKNLIKRITIGKTNVWARYYLPRSAIERAYFKSVEKEKNGHN